MFQFISYFLFILISGYITIYVGWICYSNGYLFVLELFQNNEAVAKSLNQLLLIGYYLVNLGFILYGLHCWERIDTCSEMLNLVFDKISTEFSGMLDDFRYKLGKMRPKFVQEHLPVPRSVTRS